MRVVLVALVLAMVGVPAEAAPTTLVERSRQMVADLAAGRYAEVAKSFDATVKAALPAEKLGAVWRSVLAQAGAYQKVLGTRQEKVAGFDVVYVTTQFERAVLDLQFAFNAAGEVSGLHVLPGQAPQPSPPAPEAGANWRSVEVTVGTGEWKLPGTLILPKGVGPFPAVVLVQGSGPQDRDETIGPNKPFRDLAIGLAERGVASLRYDKRTKVYPAKMAAMGNITVREEVIDDALAAAALLRARPEVKPDQVFVLGHSLGGMLAPRIGALDPKLAGIIILAGNTRPLEDLILEQTTYILGLDGGLSADDQAKLAELRRQIARVKDPNLSPATPASELPLGVPASYWIALKRYSPTETARQLKMPMLIFQGERDYQVTMADFAGWQKALAGRKDVTLKSYPNLNHLFMPGTGKATPAEYEQPGHVASEVIDDIAGWVKR